MTPSKHLGQRGMSPTAVNAAVRTLLNELGLPEEGIVFLEYSQPDGFEPEIDNCHYNVWVKCNRDHGGPQAGWIISEHVGARFIEAQFHNVWRSPDGVLRDVTPRADLEQRIMFVPDPVRQIRLVEYEGRPAIRSFDNLRMRDGQVLTRPEPIIVVPTSDF